MVEVLPIVRSVDNMMGSLLLKIVKYWQFFTLEQAKSFSEIEMTHVCYNFNIFMVLFKKLVATDKLIILHFCQPYRIYRNK